MGSLAPKERVFASLSNIADLKSAADAAMENFDDEFNHPRSGKRAARGERRAGRCAASGAQAGRCGASGTVEGERPTASGARAGVRRAAGGRAARSTRPSCFEWL